MPRESREDLLIIKNIDVDCDELTEELVRKDKTTYDDNGHAVIAFEEQIVGFDHREYFQVKFDGYPHRIAPGKERVMVRYLAEHYAKHLADHILQKKEREILEKTSRVVQLMNHATERPKVLKQIVGGVAQYYYDSEEAAESKIDAGTRLGLRMDELNANRPAPRRDVTELHEVEDREPVANKAMGKLEEGPAPGSLEAQLANVPAEPEAPPTEERDPNRPALDQPNTMTRKELVDAAESMGIQVAQNDTKEKIIEKLKQFT